MLPEDSDGFAIPACDLLSDFLCEHQCDEDEGPPEEWPAWTDDLVVGIGPAFFREESFDDPDQLPGEEVALTEPPDDWPLTGPEDLEDLRHWERLEPFEPSPEDLDRYLIDPELAHWIAYGNCRD